MPALLLRARAAARTRLRRGPRPGRAARRRPVRRRGPGRRGRRAAGAPRRRRRPVRGRSRSPRRPSASSTRCRPGRSRTRWSRSPTPWWTARPDRPRSGERGRGTAPRSGTMTRGHARGPYTEEPVSTAENESPPPAPTARRASAADRVVRPSHPVPSPRSAAGSPRSRSTSSSRWWPSASGTSWSRRWPRPRGAGPGSCPLVLGIGVGVGQWIAEARTGATAGNAILGIRTAVGLDRSPGRSARHPRAPARGRPRGARLWRRPVGRRRVGRVGPHARAARLARQGGGHGGPARAGAVRRAVHAPACRERARRVELARPPRTSTQHDCRRRGEPDARVRSSRRDAHGPAPAPVPGAPVSAPDVGPPAAAGRGRPAARDR